MSVRITMVGSGQLAQMMALAGIPMGYEFSFLVAPGEDTRCVDNLGQIVVLEDNESPQSLFARLGEPDVITVEKEHVDIELLTNLNKFCPVHPNPNALEKFKNRRDEKLFLQSLNIPIAPFYSVHDEGQLKNAIATLDKPIFLKSEEEGYDGYNQYKITDDNAEEVRNKLSFPSHWVAESFIPFQREISFLAARSKSGDIVFYPPVENAHHNGTLITSLAPAPNVSEEQVSTGQTYLKNIVNTLDYVGLICMECFVCDGKILVNEIAPRVHNSGHWSAKGALTSQFENHIRAVTGLPLGSTKLIGISGMLNLLGVTLSAEQASAESTFLTLYGKTVRPRRKLGHVTINGDDYNDIKSQLESLRKLAYQE